MLTLNFNQLLGQLRAIERSILIAVLLIVGALIYAGSLGLQWWDNVGQSNELRVQIQQLQTALTTVGHTNDGDETTIDQQMAQLGTALGRFTFASDDDIIGLIDEISRDARVKVTSAGTQDGGTRVVGPQVYRVRVASLRVEGQVTRLLDFIQRLSDAAPSLGVTSSRMGGFGQAPWLILDVELLLDPQPTAPFEPTS